MDDQTIHKTDGAAEEMPSNQGRTVVALFASEDDARKGEQALIEAGYENVVVTWNGEEATDAPKPVEHHGFWATVKAFFGDHKDAGLYGEGLRRGQTLVTVHTDERRAVEAIDILDRFHPTDVDGAEQAWHGAEETTLVPTSLDDVPAEDRPAYIAAAADPERVDNGTTEQPRAGGRDLDAGNARVRSYVASGSSTVAEGEDERKLRNDDSILSDTDEDGPYVDGEEAPSNAPNKAWLDRTDGLEDKRPLSGARTDNDPQIEPRT